MSMYIQECYCKNCEYIDDCEDAYIINFCDDCINGYECDLRSAFFTCKAGHEVECDNGFELNENGKE